MAILEYALYSLINGKREIKEPIFLKEFENENQQLKDLIELASKVTSKKKYYIEKDISLLKHGLDGEQRVYFELKNAPISMLCFHDIRLEIGDQVAQFDFILITRKVIYVLETKKLSGDIEINQDGDFIRIIKNSEGKFIKKEGMESPISQNNRHVTILEKALTKEGILSNYPIKSMVVIANPKTIINKKYCPEQIKSNIYKHDQVVNKIYKELTEKADEFGHLEKTMFKIAEFILKNHRPIAFNNTAKYSLTDDDFKPTISYESDPNTEAINHTSDVVNKEEVKAASEVEMPLEATDIYKNLKEFRLNKSREEGIKPYFIFNNEEMENLIKANPRTKEDIIKIKGFGEKKTQKYGDEILLILAGKNESK